jgi:phenylalanyl-tRNA synthetase beta chain
MKVALGWLSELVDLPASLEELVERLTLGGLEIEGVERAGPDLSGLCVGHVLVREKHPNADRLSLCRVDVGEAEPLEIVCGAPNVADGQKVAVARTGTRLPDGTKLKKTKIRGVVSHGMICSEVELGLGDAHEGILVLDPEAPVGAPLSEALGAGDVVLDVEITPNRGDWASMLGIAREVRAHFGGELRLPASEPEESGEPAAVSVQIGIDDADGCYRYAGRVVRGIRVGPSPDWLRERLEAAGLRSINNIVDVTNLVLLELGQPLHAFDLSTLRGAEVRVRRASAGEKLITLDTQSRALGPDDLVIADAERTIAVAGVMGGAETEVREATRDILIESAHFDPSRVRSTARRLGLHSDASYRFERGVDRGGIERAADRAAGLIAEIAGGQVAPGCVVALGNPAPATASVELDPARVNRLLGTSLDEAEMVAILERLDLCRRPGGNGRLRFEVPSYRNDLHAPTDLIEEVARVYGYDRIPTTLPAGPLAEVRVPPLRPWMERCRDSLRASGLCELMTFPVLHSSDPDRLRLAEADPRRRLVHITNPLVDEESGLRSTLVPSLLRSVQSNLARQVERVPVFEVGPVFGARDGGELPDERQSLVAALTDAPGETLWDGSPPPLFFRAKGIAEQLLDDLGIAAELVSSASEPYVHPRASCAIRSGRRTLGVVGELHPETAAAYEIDVPCAIIELDLQALPEAPGRDSRYREVSRQPLVRRDLAYVFDRDRPAGELLRAIREAGGAALVSVALFDRYEGKGVPEGKVSLGFRLVFQLPDRTLTDADVIRHVERVERVLTSEFDGEKR